MVVAATGCGGDGDGHVYVTCCRGRFQIITAEKGYCTDAHRLTTKAVPQDYCTIIGLTERFRFNKTKKTKYPPPHYTSSRPDKGDVFFRGYTET